MATVRARLGRACTHPAAETCPTCSWRVEWRRGGRGGTRESATFPARELAESAAKLAQVRRHRLTADEAYEVVLDLRPDANNEPVPTVAEWAVQWITQRRAVQDVQPDTISYLHGTLARYVTPHLGHMPLDLVTPEVVHGWVAWMTRKPSRRGGTLDAETIRHAHGVLHSMLGAAVPQWLPANPAARPPGQSRARSGLPKPTPHEGMFLTAAELELIDANCSPAIRDLVFTAVRTGLRLGEILGLRVEDLTLTGPRKAVRVRQARKRDGSFGPPKSRRSLRAVSISGEVAEVLRQRVAGRRPQGLVFTAPGGAVWNPSNLAARHWLPALAAAQRCPHHPPPTPAKPPTGPRRKLRNDEVSTCDCPSRLHRRPRFHDLRHTHASLCLDAGWPLERVSRRLGHEGVQITFDLYGHLRDGDPDDRLNAVEKLLLVADDEAA